MKLLLLAIVLVFAEQLFAKDLVVYTALQEKYNDNGDANSEIYMLDLATKKPVRITNHPAMDYSPTLHPNGKMIAFISDRWRYDLPGDEQIVLKTLPDGEETHLDTGRFHWHAYPKFSADGKTLYFSQADAYSQSKPMSSYKIMAYNLETKTIRSVFAEIPGNFFDLSPSPDGKKLAYRYAYDGDQHVRVMDLGTGQSEMVNPNRPPGLKPAEMMPAWRSNSVVTVIAEYGDHEHLQRSLFQMSLTGAPASQILRSPLVNDYHQVCWINSDIGVMAAADENYDIELFSITGEKLAKITSSQTEVRWNSEPDCRRIK